MCSVHQDEAYLELVRLAFLGQDIRLGTISSHQQLPQSGHLGRSQLKTVSKVLGSRDEALEDANISVLKQLDGG